MCRQRASPLPEPQGITAKAVSVQSSRHFVEGAVAAHRRHDVVNAYSLFCQCRSVAGSFREDYLIRNALKAKHIRHMFPKPPFVAMPGYGVDNEENPFFRHYFPLIVFKCGKGT